MLLAKVEGHGYMIEPAQRGSMWRKDGAYPSMPADYNDMSLNAGGPSIVRQDMTNLKYGVCGDVFSDPVPRAHESGGKYGLFNSIGKDAIARCYQPGQDIQIDITMTAHHKGTFEYQLCVLEAGQDESEACFANGPKLNMAGTNNPVYQLPDEGNKVYSQLFTLPNDVSCEGNTRCVLRWYWLTGNSPGSDMKEEFWNCADIQIGTCNGDAAPAAPVTAPAPPLVQQPAITPAPVIVQPVATPALTPSPAPALRTIAQAVTIATVPEPANTVPIQPAAVIPANQNTPPAGTTQVYSDCSCTGGACTNNECSNCLLSFGNQRMCYQGWAEWQCENARLTTPGDREYRWCGA